MDRQEGGVNFDRLPQWPAGLESQSLWTRALDRIVSGEMPPKRKPRPPAKDQAEFVETLQRAVILSESHSSGTTSQQRLRRLNRTEYENTL
ncbi:MAG: hypothetical protein ACRCZF_24945, partial [Gemmataceae bacterium]